MFLLDLFVTKMLTCAWANQVARWPARSRNQAPGHAARAESAWTQGRLRAKAVCRAPAGFPLRASTPSPVSMKAMAAPR